MERRGGLEGILWLPKILLQVGTYGMHKRGAQHSGLKAELMQTWQEWHIHNRVHGVLLQIILVYKTIIQKPKRDL